MVEGLNIMSSMGYELQLTHRFPKGIMNRIKAKASVCPQCGYIELYTEDLEIVKNLTK
jgi:predicted nucleic-acid-binding Zn-ribbon protein